MKTTLLTSETNQTILVEMGGKQYHRKYYRQHSDSMAPRESIEWYEISVPTFNARGRLKIWNKERLAELEGKYKEEINLMI